MKLPKIELHVHLDGSMRPTTAAELLDKDIIIVEREMVVSNDCQSLNDYLTKFKLPIQLLQTKENLKRVAFELAEDLKKDGVIYAEIRFAPLQHTKDGLTGREVVDAVLEGLSMIDLKTNLILCMMRNASYEENLEVIELAQYYLNNGVVAIDLAGAESLYPTSNFLDLFEIAHQKEIPYTIHAGEADGKESILEAIKTKTRRIGHGIKAIEYPELMELIKENEILLEICPTSNVQTKVVENYDEHPIGKLYDYGCIISINTDNRTVSNLSLTEEYEKIQKSFQFTEEDFYKINKKAIEYTFLNDFEKQRLIETLNLHILNER